MHIADMELVGPGDDAFGDRMMAREDQILARKVQLLDGERHQGEIVAEF